MIWNAARAASKRPLTRRVDHGLVTTLPMAPDYVQRTLAKRSDHACPACGFIQCNPIFHYDDLPTEWLPTIVPPGHPPAWGLALHPKTTAAVWCIAREQWVYQYKWNPSKGIDGHASTRTEAMDTALFLGHKLVRGSLRHPDMWQLIPQDPLVIETRVFVRAGAGGGGARPVDLTLPNTGASGGNGSAPPGYYPGA